MNTLKRDTLEIVKIASVIPVVIGKNTNYGGALIVRKDYGRSVRNGGRRGVGLKEYQHGPTEAAATTFGFYIQIRGYGDVQERTP